MYQYRPVDKTSSNKLHSIIIGFVLVSVILLFITSQGWLSGANSIPQVIPFQGKLQDSAGTPLTGSYTVTFRIYDTASGGTALWSEKQTINASSGIFSAYLGDNQTLNLEFNTTYYLSIEVGSDGEMSPRVRLGSAPYTINALSSNVQTRVSGTCASGSSIRVINENGTVTCETDDVGTGDITGVTAGTGLSGGGTSGSVTVNADTSYVQRRVSSSCSAGSSIRAIGVDGSVTCETDDSGTGDITQVRTASTSSGCDSGNCDLRNIDGSGSGLDADLLDGQSGSYYKDSCPSGFTDTGYGYCIQTNEASSGGIKTWYAASDYCADTYGARLCTSSEWYNACVNNKANAMTDDYEWVDSWPDYTYALVRGGGSCAVVYYFDAASYYGVFRCCKSL